MRVLQTPNDNLNPNAPKSPHQSAPHPCDIPNTTDLPLSFTAPSTWKHIVPASHGYAFHAPRNSHIRIVDLHGEQVVDLMSWIPSSSPGPISSLERMSTAYTRYHLSGVQPAIGESLWSNCDRPILRVVADTVKVHDMTFMSCFPALYEKKGIRGHRSCAQNIFEAMRDGGFGMRSIAEIAEPFNVFQNTPNYSLKRLGSSRKGDFIEFEALEEVVVAVSSCPYDLDGFNGGRVTDVGVMVAGEEGFGDR